MSYVITYGRTDGSAIKRTTFRSRIRSLKLANNLAYVFFYRHPFKNSEAKQSTRFEGNGFFVQYEETDAEEE